MESCMDCIHHDLCKYEHKMMALSECADSLAYEYMLVVSNLLINEVGDRIRCARWTKEDNE